MALKRSLAATCPQTTVSALGFRPMAPQTLRFRLTDVELGDEAFVEETTTWDGGSDTPSARPDDGTRTYTVYVRMGSVVVIYGEFPTEQAAVAGGAKAAARARTGLVRAAAAAPAAGTSAAGASPSGQAG